MRITFKKIEILNFKSFQNEVFEFEKHKGLNLICGKNNDIPGSKNATGKSNIGNALVFSLFGQTQENIKNGNIANKYVGSKEVRVATYFDIEDHQYKVVSGHNKNGMPYCQLFETIDGEEHDLTKSTMTETRKFLMNEILHCDLSIFLRTVLLSSDQNYNFFRLKKWEKKEFIEKLFDIQVFGEMYNCIHRDVLDYDKDLISRQNRLILLNKNNDEYKTRMEKHEIDKKQKLETLNESISEFSDKKSTLTEKNIKLNSEEVAKYETAEQKVNDLIEKYANDLRKLQKEKSKFEVAFHKLSTLKESKQKNIDKHSELLSKLCDDCKITFSKYYNIDAIEAELKEIDEKSLQINNKIKDSEKNIDSIEAKQNEMSIKSKKISEKIKSLTDEYNKTHKELTAIETKIELIEKEIAKIEKSENPYSELYNTNQIEMKSEQDDLDKRSENYKYLKFAENIVSQDTLRKFIISDLIGLLNNKIKSYLTKFGAKYDVTFDADMNYSLTTSAGQFEYDNFSSGERARLMIAACFAFRDFMYIRNNFSSNILFLDEFIDGAIDSMAIESILAILKDFSQLWDQNIFVISHRKSEMETVSFDNIIQVVKTDNISKITYLET